MTYDGLLLDHDGVVVQPLGMDRLRTTAADALAAAGIDDPDEAEVDAITVGVSRESVFELARRYDVDPARLWQFRDDRVHETLRDALAEGHKRPYDDVAALWDVDLPMGLVSNNQARFLSVALAHHGLDSLFDTVRAREATLDSLREKKPNPAYLERAMDDIGVSNPLYVGDSESDIVAARRAGIDGVFIRRGHNADRDIECDPAHEVGTMHDVLALVDRQ